MEKTRQETVVENAVDNANDIEKDVRTLKDMELMLVGGGGDDIIVW